MVIAPQSPDPVATMARIRARRDGGLALWWWSGEVFGRRPDDLPRRLLGITGVGFNRLQRDESGGWQFAMSEAGYHADAESGVFLEEWINPYNQRRTKPPHIKMITRYRIDDAGIIHPPFPGVRFNSRILPVVVHGDRVWASELLSASFPPAPPAGAASAPMPGGNPMEISRFCGSLADIRNDALADVPATMEHSSVWPFHPWMEMEGQAGEVVTSIIGRKLRDSAELPGGLRARIERDHPGFLANPGI